jgi:serine/threonine protein kinase/tetratricopeptide (TPR) repeat protein
MICPGCQAENPAGAEVCPRCGRSLSALTRGSLIAGRYEVQGVLGTGGMGMVYRAHDRMLDETVAIKVLRQEYAATPAMAERFRSEIRLARKVSHPNVCRIHDYGEDAGMTFISMELLEGVDLKRRLTESPSGLPPAEAYQAALQMAQGLAAIHEVGIIHRDLKTPNAMRDAAGVVKLMDFGIAKSPEGRSQTATGQVMGTPEYMSPEQCRGEKLDLRSDIYALGIVIYELFTGQVPFRGENMMATLFKQIEEPASFEGPVGSRVPRSLVPVLERALAKDRERRYRQVGELHLALEEAQKQGDSAVSPPQPSPQPEPGTALPRPRAASDQERRSQNRLEIHLNVLLCRLDGEGKILHEERTVAENVGRHGARVMTSVPDLKPGELVVVKEVGGDFVSHAVVRHAYVGPDHIPRVGIQFKDKTAPDRLVLTDGDRLPTPRPRSPRANAPDTPAQSASARAPAVPAQHTSATAPPGDPDRRGHTRLSISVDIVLRRLGAGSEREERTVADNVSRTGARVLTSMTDLGPGDRLALREIGGDFETEAVVRNTYVGADRIFRVGVEFLGQAAPDRLVPPSPQTRRSRRAAAVFASTEGATEPRSGKPAGEQAEARRAAGAEAGEATPTERRRQILELHASLTTRSFFELLGIDRSAREADVKQAYIRLARQYHPDASRDPGLVDLQRELAAIFARLGEAYETLRDPEKRGRYESRLGRRKPDERAPAAPGPTVVMGPTIEGTKPSAPPTPQDSPQPPPPPPPDVPETAEQRALRIDTVIRAARQHFQANQFWEAIQILEPLVEETAGTRQGVPIRLLLAQALAKNPNWLKRAEELAIGVTRDDAKNVEAHFLLGTLYRQAGLASRARTALRKVLELDRRHAGAASELDALEAATKSTRR